MTPSPHAVPLDEFRSEVRAFLRDQLPPSIQSKVRLGQALDKAELMDWHRTLYRQGWIAPGWPREFGGAAWSAAQKHVFDDECATAGAPNLIPMGLTIVGPILIAYGSPAQQQRYLPRILDGSEVWCQGFSEPDAGSDLASLRCKAVRDGDHYVINGTKIWTTQAHWAEQCMVLTRTSTGKKKQEGITVLLVDMKLPGVRVRPLPSLDGLHVLNQVYFDDVRVPVGARVGDEDRGWTVLKANIGNERIHNADIGRSKALLRRLDAIVAEEQNNGHSLASDAGLRRRIARMKIELKALELTALRWMDDPALAVKPETAFLKVRGTELQQRITELMSEAVGHYGLPQHADWIEGRDGALPIGPDYAGALTPFYFFWRKASISAGTSEVMRNLIATGLLK